MVTKVPFQIENFVTKLTLKNCFILNHFLKFEAGSSIIWMFFIDPSPFKYSCFGFTVVLLYESISDIKISVCFNSFWAILNSIPWGITIWSGCWETPKTSLCFQSAESAADLYVTFLCGPPCRRCSWQLVQDHTPGYRSVIVSGLHMNLEEFNFEYRHKPSFPLCCCHWGSEIVQKSVTTLAGIALILSSVQCVTVAAGANSCSSRIVVNLLTHSLVRPANNAC